MTISLNTELSMSIIQMDVDLVLSVDLLPLDTNRSRSHPGVADHARRDLDSTNLI